MYFIHIFNLKYRHDMNHLFNSKLHIITIWSHLFPYKNLNQSLFRFRLVHRYCPSFEGRERPCEVITCSHLLIHRRHCAAEGGCWYDVAPRPGSLREGVRGTAERRSSPHLWPQLHWLIGRTVDLHHSQVRVALCSRTPVFHNYQEYDNIQNLMQVMWTAYCIWYSVLWTGKH